MKIAEGWRALSHKVEAAYGNLNATAAGADFVAFPYKGGPLFRKSEVITNADDVNGAFLPNQAVLYKTYIEDSIKGYLTPEMAAIILRGFAGTEATVTTVGTTGKQHIYKCSGTKLGDSTTGQLRTMNLIEKEGSTIVQYSGLVCPSLKVMFKRGAWVEFEAPIHGFKATQASSILTTNAQMKAIRVAESYLKHNDVQFKRGTTYTANNSTTLDVLGGTVTSWHAKMISGELNVGDEVEKQWQMGDTTKYVSKLEPTKAIAELSAVFEADATTEWQDFFEAETEFGIEIPIEGATIAGGTAKYTCTFDFSRVRVASVETGEDSGKLTRVVKFHILADPGAANDQWMQANIINLRATNYTATF
jgi:hypothetical protein